MEFISDITITQKAYSIISINIIPPTLWLNKISNILNECGMSNICNTQTCINSTWLINTVKLKLRDQFEQKRFNWHLIKRLWSLPSFKTLYTAHVAFSVFPCFAFLKFIIINIHLEFCLLKTGFLGNFTCKQPLN
jgi:hypothetical protein